MRMMMRHRHGGQPAARGKVGGGARAVVIRMQIMGDDLRLDLRRLQHAVDRLVEQDAALGVVQRADVRRQESLVAAGDADAALEVRAEGEHRRPGVGQADAAGVDGRGGSQGSGACASA